MRVSNFGFVALGVVLPTCFALYSCGTSSGDNGDAGVGADGSADSPTFNSDSPTGQDAGQAIGTFTSGDCPGCTFPPIGAPPCGSGSPAIKIVYPSDGVLVPPNMSVMSVQWTPFGSAYTEFEVDFENAATDMRVITKCAKQTIDNGQPPIPSGGCELVLDPAMWAFVSNANRGGQPVAITVRGTTDKTCATPSTDNIAMSFATEDVLGGIYYWKSTVSVNGVGGQIWVKSFGDSTPEQLVTTTLTARCAGCHSLSRDGLRMAVYSDDDDSDDEYGDVRGSLIDMKAKAPIGNAAQPPGFSTFSPDHSLYLTSDGTARAPTNSFGVWDGIAGATSTQVTIGPAGSRPTMPDWSPDGKSVVFVMPTKVGSWDVGTRNDDSHVFGGSLFTVVYNGNSQFGAAAPLITSGGENNYYPSYSPDGKFILFNRTPNDTSVTGIDGCTGTAPQRSCPNDSFSNPAARLMVMSNAQGAAPIDLEAANGSPAASPAKLSNSWPRWSPFLQKYKGSLLLWIAYSSTRDYGLRVRNHQPGMFQCYPADSFQDPGSAHHQGFGPLCQQPQLWMAAINLSEAAAGGVDPSRTAFWLPFQDITTHNHTPQWTQTVATNNDAGACIPMGGNCLQNPGGCCTGSSCNASGTCQGIIR